MKYSIPKRENELRASGPSPVIVTQLTPEELEEVRQKYPATSKDKGFKKPVEIKPRPKGEEDMPRGRKKAESTPPLREKEVTEQKPVSQELLDKAGEEIERLTAELQRVRGIADEYKTQRYKMGDQISTLMAERDKLVTDVNRMEEYAKRLEAEQTSIAVSHKLLVEKDERIKDLEAERDGLITEVNQLTDRVIELEENTYCAEVAELPVPQPSEVQLLDTAIADLTRARRLMHFLAAGE